MRRQSTSAAKIRIASNRRSLRRTQRSHDQNHAAFRRLIALGLLGIAALPLYVAPAAAQADFKGETISIQIGYGPGGGYDTYGRALARHYGRFIPGNPNVVPKNMPGAGSLRAANHVYNLAARDPIDIALFSASTAVEPLMGNEQAKFDVTKFGWIGSMNQDISFCGVWLGAGPARPRSPTCSSRDGKELIFGSAGPGGDQPSASADPEERARRQHPRHLRLRGAEAGQPRHAARRGAWRLRPVRLLDQGAVDAEREGGRAQAVPADGTEDLRRVRRRSPTCSIS